MKIPTRFKIVGTEVVGLGAFLLLILVLQLRENHFASSIESFGWVYAIIGVTLILVGLETVSLVRSLPSHQEEKLF